MPAFRCAWDLNPPFDDPFVFGQLWKKGALDSAPLIQALRERRFCTVVIRDPSFWSDPVFDEMIKQYLPIAQIECSPMGYYVVLVPR